MNKEEIINAIRELSHSQGFYGRLLEAINQNPEILDELEEQHFHDVVDMVLFIEC